MYFKTTNVDKFMHTWEDEGVYPNALGTYHMYHRIDGRLVAIGVILGRLVGLEMTESKTLSFTLDYPLDRLVGLEMT